MYITYPLNGQIGEFSIAILKVLSNLGLKFKKGLNGRNSQLQDGLWVLT